MDAENEWPQMKNRIMILGAGVYQVPLIIKANEMGLETIVISPKGNYPGILLADIFLEIDTTDSKGILKAAKIYDIGHAHLEPEPFDDDKDIFKEVNW